MLFGKLFPHNSLHRRPGVEIGKHPNIVIDRLAKRGCPIASQLQHGVLNHTQASITALQDCHIGNTAPRSLIGHSRAGIFSFHGTVQAGAQQ